MGAKSRARASFSRLHVSPKGAPMEDLLSELHEYERATITLRLDEQEAKALTCALAECSCDAHKRDAIELTEKLAHEMDAFKWRRLETVDLATQRTDNVAMAVNNQEEATMPTTKARTAKTAKTKICTRCKKR